MIMTEHEMDKQIELMEMMRDATEEEVESVHNYIDSISESLYTFTEEALEEHDKQIRKNEINRVISMTRNYLGCYDNECENCYFKNGESCKFDNLWEQLKEKK